MHNLDDMTLEAFSCRAAVGGAVECTSLDNGTSFPGDACGWDDETGVFGCAGEGEPELPPGKKAKKGKKGKKADLAQVRQSSDESSGEELAQVRQSSDESSGEELA